MEINRAVRGFLLIGSLFLVILMAWVLGSGSKEDAPEILKKIPVFEFPLIGQSGVITRHQFKGRALVVSYFNPDCSHCQMLADGVGKRSYRLVYKVGGKSTRVAWLWVTRFDEDQAWDFMKQYGLAGRPDVWLAADREGTFYGAFGDMHVPSIYVFDAGGRYLQTVYDQPSYGDVLQILAGKKVNKPKKSR
ncbi:MAG: TlpA family protein disulfide reductase [Bacteroidota bacterium]